MAEGNSYMSQEMNKTHPEYANYLNVMCAEMSCILCILQTVPSGSVIAGSCFMHTELICFVLFIYIYIYIYIYI